MTTKNDYDFSTGELHGDPICRHCGGLVLASSTTPAGKDAAVWHGTAKCVEGNEPSYKMGGPA